MNDVMTTVLRVAFLVILIWVLAALTGTSVSASVSGSRFRARIGKGDGGGCRHGRGRKPRWMWGSNGMVGELIPTTGAAPQLAGMSEF